MSTNRRDFFSRVPSIGAGLAAAPKLLFGQQPKPPAPMDHSKMGNMQPPAPSKVEGKAGKVEPGKRVSAEIIPVETPDAPKLPWKMIDGVKEFHLVAEVVRTEFLPGRVVDAWGYSGSVPGPTIEVNEGDRVRVIFENHLPEMTTVHWHGFEVPMEMDGVPGLGQEPVMPGGALCLRIHHPSARHVLLPLAFCDAGNARNDWAVDQAS